MQQFCETDVCIIPGNFDDKIITELFHFLSLNQQGLAVVFNRTTDGSLFPFFSAAYQAFPEHFSFLQHGAGNVGILVGGFQAKYLDLSAGSFLKNQSCFHHFGIVENQ